MGRERARATGDVDIEADIRFTEHGVPHIRSDSWRGLGFGQGWAIAGDHLPTISDQIIKVRSERALFHGAGAGEHHLASDLGYLALGVVEHAGRCATPNRDGYVSWSPATSAATTIASAN